ncbi:fatty acid desaturase family protein [Nocardia pseudovaccinii]|uniref:fatty acid desaturase family protein n=1 Tax=Nocardia pseudovaccinii TaxID=189540 RepID=UPI003D8BA8DD
MTTTEHELRIAEAPVDTTLFAELRSQIRQAGLLDMRPGYYAAKISLTLAAWAAGWAAFGWLSRSWWQLLLCVFISECAVQLAFIFHDASHKEITHSKRLTQVIGYTIGNLLLGVSWGWWINHHGKHHSNPNHLDLDPDITRKIAIFDPSHADQRQGWKLWVVKHQAHIYFPLTSLDTLRLRVASIGAIKNGEVRRPVLESVLFVIHGIVFFGAMFTVLDVGKAIAFIVLYHALVGLHLGMSFAPNHKGMPTTQGEPAGWLERQVLTSRNVRPNWATDFLYGGLNYQIEHHLFPTMPRSNFKRARPIVRGFLISKNYGYTETGVLESMRDIVDHLDWASRPVRDAAAG